MKNQISVAGMMCMADRRLSALHLDQKTIRRIAIHAMINLSVRGITETDQAIQMAYKKIAEERE